MLVFTVRVHLYTIPTRYAPCAPSQVDKEIWRKKSESTFIIINKYMILLLQYYNQIILHACIKIKLTKVKSMVLLYIKTF